MADFKPDFLGYNFVWFMGVVEDRDDPLKLGRVKIRCFGWHPTDSGELPTDGLPWAQTVQPVTAPAAPSSGLTEGTWVFGFFMDGEDAQRPMIVGQVPGYRFDSEGKNSESELPRAARVEEKHPSPQSEVRKKQRVTGIVYDAFAGSTWDEPLEPNDKAYPYVQTVSSEAGFITEIIFKKGELNLNTAEYDPNTGNLVGEDKPDQARQVTYDTSGGFDERKSPSGDKVVKVIGDNYEVICGYSYMYVKGDLNLTVDGNMNQNITKNYTMTVGGDYYVAVGGDEDLNVTGLGTYNYGLGRTTEIAAGGDERTVQAGGSTDLIVAGGMKTTVEEGGKTTTVNGATKLTVTGNHTVDITGNQTITISDYHEFTSATHSIQLGSGTLEGDVIIANRGDITTINSTTGNISSVYAPTVKTSASSTINIMTHKHIASGTPTTTPIP